MFEVIIINLNGTKETYDALDATQAECIYFRSCMRANTDYVEINEIIENVA